MEAVANTIGPISRLPFGGYGCNEFLGCREIARRQSGLYEPLGLTMDMDIHL